MWIKINHKKYPERYHHYWFVTKGQEVFVSAKNKQTDLISYLDQKVCKLVPDNLKRINSLTSFKEKKLSM